MRFHAWKLANNFCHLTTPLGDVLAAAEGDVSPGAATCCPPACTLQRGSQLGTAAGSCPCCDEQDEAAGLRAAFLQRVQEAG